MGTRIADVLLPRRAALRRCRSRLERLQKLHAHYAVVAHHPQHRANPELEMVVADLDAVLYGDRHGRGRF